MKDGDKQEAERKTQFIKTILFTHHPGQYVDKMENGSPCQRKNILVVAVVQEAVCRGKQ